MTFKRAARFKCSDCDIEISVQIVVVEDNEIRLVGKCHQCETILRFPLDKLVAVLSEELQLATPPMMVN